MEKNLKSIGALFADSWRLYRKHMNVFALISVIPFLFVGVRMAFTPFLYNYFGQPTSLAAAVVLAVFGLLYLVFMIVMPFAVSVAVCQAEEGKIPNVNAVYERAFSSILPYLLVLVLSVIVVIGGSILFIIPGIIASVYLNLAMYAYIFDGRTGIDALVTSAWYVRNFWWDILARKIVLAILVIMAMLVFAAIVGPILFTLGFSVAVFKFLFGLFAFTAVIPFCLTVYYNIYKDVKHAQHARGRTGAPEKSFALDAERIFIILIIVAAVAAVLLFLFLSLHPFVFHHSFGSGGPMMMYRHYGAARAYQSQYQY